MKYLIGIDLGGTNVVCGLLNTDLGVLKQVKIPTERHLGYQNVLHRIAEMIKDLLVGEGIKTEDVAAVGAGIPGLINPDEGISIFAGNMNWRNMPVAQDLSDLIHLPVFIDNDVRMITLGEALKGAGRGFRHVLGITLGTGMAGSIVQDGQLFYGGGYMAGEIGHLRVDGESFPCGCGLKGCLETVASATGIARLAKERIQQGASSVLSELAPSVEGITSALVSEAYDRGDSVAVEVMNYVGRMLGRGLISAIHLISPDVIVIGGGAAHAGERLLKPMREELQAGLIAPYWERLQIRLSELSDDAGLVGSASFAYRRLNK
ncbi:ROK family protein [Paenibacillus eucommiae]|uniref:Glucokinase n=1 Tax=Paenibacillus eucommiae TaxID=1355755 RepID=A0ABS4J0L6_9BACL|nr:ROK family protein [Paenibacillus eucommiae]MBP1993387.1 glucokinase [Paenibacillus eucommiae]